MTHRTRKPRHASTWKQNIRRARVLEQSYLIRANCDLVGLFVSGSNHFFFLFVRLSYEIWSNCVPRRSKFC